jgi:subtilisin family serine protease
MRVGRMVGVVVLAAAVAVASQLGISSGAHAAPKRNPFGITVVTFKPGTTPAQMQDAITRAGGQVVTDLSRLGAVAALPDASDFATRITKDSHVKATWEDRVFTRPRPDVAQEDAGKATGNPALGNPGTAGPPDPWHNLPSFLGETNPEGILQWDDNRMNVPAAWATTTGDRTVRVAVIDTGVQGSHKELLANYDNQTSANTIPCNELTRTFGNAIVKQFNLKDCSSEDTEGHGTWVASRIAGAANGFASNGVAPNVQIVGYKVLATGFGGLTSWIIAGMIDACSNNVDIINMSIGGYDDPSDPFGAQDYLLWVAAVNYCRAQGTAIFASAGNEHVRVNRVNMTVGGVPLTGVGQVDTGPQGIASILPGSSLASGDLRGRLEVPAGVPGVIMVSATGNAIGAAGADVPAAIRWPAAFTGKKDQLAYYSNFGPRVDIAAPGGARKFNIPRYDGGPGDILYGGWGTLGALDPSGEICTDPSLASLLTFACFKVEGAGFGWLQGTSMSSPNAAGVAALTLAAHHELQGNPDALLARLKTTARTDMTNHTGPNDPANTAPSYAGVPCSTGYCHVDFAHPLGFSDAYGAGIVNAGAAVAP